MDVESILKAATPRPWCWSEIGNAWLEGADKTTVMHVDDYGNECPHSNDPNGKLIVLAVNAYEKQRECIREFIEAVEGIIDTQGFRHCDCDEPQCGPIRQAIAALVRAKELLK